MQATIEAAVVAHNAGRLQEAEASYREILARDPRTVDPMSLMDLKVDATVIGGETVYEG